MKPHASLAVGLVLALALAPLARAQRGGGNFFGGALGCPDPPIHNIPYDGRFTFVRVRYSPSPSGYWPGRRPSWIHGYPSPSGT